MIIHKLLTPINFTDCNNTGRIKYIVWHYVGALGDAKANCDYYASHYVGASAHYYIGFNGEKWQSVEDGDIAWSVGSSYYVHPECRNSNSINIELCVRKKSTATMGATDRDWYFEDATIKSAIELTRYLMEKYHIPVDNVLRHYDVTGKICPNPLVYNHTKYTWAGIKAALIAKETMPEKPQPTELYRIRKSWSNKKSQLGAYKSLSKAKANCPAGYKVFSRNGNVVYTKKKRKSPVSVKHSPAIKAWQEAVLFDGFNLPSGATGEWSKECDMVARKALVGISTTPVSKVFHRVVVAQNLLNNYGFPCGKADGQCGKNTLSAIKAFQNAHSLTSDGIIGLDTWKKLLGVA